MADAFKACSVDGCNGNAHWRKDGKRGWCARHYARWRAHGSPIEGRVDNGSLETFFRTVALTHSSDQCLLWPYGTSDNGYGTLRVNGRKYYAHRFICEMTHGPDSYSDAAHSCGNRQCVNPSHLRWASRQENMADAVEHGTLRARRAKLTVPQVRNIKAALAAGEKPPTIAKRYPISEGAIYAISRNKNWKWV